MTKSHTARSRPRGSFAMKAGALASVAALGLAALAFIGPAPAPEAVAPAARAANDAAPAKMAQQLGGTCRTATTVCPLPAALPIGAYCDCGGQPGTVSP